MIDQNFYGLITRSHIDWEYYEYLEDTGTEHYHKTYSNQTNLTDEYLVDTEAWWLKISIYESLIESLSIVIYVYFEQVDT